MLPDPGCYEERYRLTAGAAPTLGASLFTIGLLFRTEALWMAGVVIAVLAIVAARRVGQVIAQRPMSFALPRPMVPAIVPAE